MNLRHCLPVLGLILLACNKQDAAKTAATTPENEPPRLVKVLRLSDAQIKGGAMVAGLPAEIKPRIEVRQGFRVAGKLIKRQVEVGQKVAAGTVLARLDVSDYALATAAQEAQVNAARTELNLANTELKRLQNLQAQNFVSAAQVDRQQAAVEAAQARLKAADQGVSLAKNNSAYTTLTAEVAGVVTALEAEVGQVLSAGQPVVRIAKTSDIEAWVAIPESAVASFKNQKNFEVEVPSMGQKYNASMRELSPMADPLTRTLIAKLTMPQNADLSLGSTAYVRALSSSTPSIQVVLPLAAITSKTEQAQVWVVNGTTVKATQVTLGAIRGEWVEIAQGLKGNELVVSAGAAFLRDGQTVRVYQDPNEQK